MSEAPDRIWAEQDPNRWWPYNVGGDVEGYVRADKVQALVDAAQVVNDALWGLGPTPRDHDRLEMALAPFIKPQEPKL